MVKWSGIVFLIFVPICVFNVRIPDCDVTLSISCRPVSSHVPFEPNTKDLKSGKYVSSINFTNPNDSGSVAFKIKTNSPKRYNVKPSSGCIAPGR